MNVRQVGFSVALLLAAPLLAEEPKVRHTLNNQAVLAAVFNPDGKTLALAIDARPNLTLWDMSTGKARTTSVGEFACSVEAVAFSPDGKTMAAAICGPGGPLPVKLWDVATDQARTTLPERWRFVQALAFSPDGKTLASGNSDGFKLWEAATGKELASVELAKDKEQAALREQKKESIYLVFSTDGKTLAFASSDKTIRLHSMASGRQRAVLKDHAEAVTSVAFSPDGRTLASGSRDKTIRLWELATGKERAIFKEHTEAVTSVAFSPDGKTLASGSRDKTIRLWELATRKERAILKNHTEAVTFVAFSLDGKSLASAGQDTTAKLWDLPGNKRTETTSSLSRKDLDGLWTTLAGDDAAKAYQVSWTLVGAPDQAVPQLKERLLPALQLDTQPILQLIADLENEQFDVRQKASVELEKFGDRAETTLREKLTARPALEVRRRIEQVLSKIEQQPLRPESLQAVRAVEVLEHIGSPQARVVLEMLARGAKVVHLATEAQASLDRLSARRGQ
jgi:dipeptidyl aminopeptidase/acylaminoacyl peptidase